jgi:hypothetical protein
MSQIVSQGVESVQVEVIEPVIASQENLAKVQGFLRWLGDLYDQGDMYLIACDNELSDRFGEIREVFPAILAAVTTTG